MHSFGGNVISAFATEVFFSNLGKIDRLSLLDPGNMVSKYDVQGEYKAVEGKQYGFVNKVRLQFLFLQSSMTFGLLLDAKFPFRTLPNSWMCTIPQPQESSIDEKEPIRLWVTWMFG